MAAFKNRLSIFSKRRSAQIAIGPATGGKAGKIKGDTGNPLKLSGPRQPHPIPATVDRDKDTQIERHVYADGSKRFVRPGQHGHGMHKRPTSDQAKAATAKPVNKGKPNR